MDTEIKNENKTICGQNCCCECLMSASCGGCRKTDGKPFGGKCIAAECVKFGSDFSSAKKKYTDIFNSLGIDELKIDDLYTLPGSFINSEYTLKNGSKVKLLSDSEIYFGNQTEKKDGRCYGIATDGEYLLVSEYGKDGENAEIIIYKKI